MRCLGPILLLALSVFAAPVAAQDPLPATAADSELRQMCEADRGQLWGVTLCGPLLVVDPATRSVWASQPDRQGVLRWSGASWVGTLPEGVGVANTSLDWAGLRWIMLVAPLPSNPADRRVLVAHEAWHRVQATIGLPQQSTNAAHLETERGRYLMRLEFRALGTALRSRGRGRLRAAREALMFRATRHAEFREASQQESALDRNEGLAAYTGVKLGITENADLYAARLLDEYGAHNALSRSYAYATGPAYGLLLDDYMPDWRSRVTSAAPGDLLAAAVDARRADARDVRRATARYNGKAILSEERARAEAQRARVAELQNRFADGPRLELPLQQMQFEFDPNAVTPVEGLGSYYATLTLRDVWGELTATEGALISPDFTLLTAARPGPDGLSGPGWRLQLNPGYQLAGPDLHGVFRPVQAPPEDLPPT